MAGEIGALHVMRVDLHPEIKSGSPRLFTGIQDVCRKPKATCGRRHFRETLTGFHRRVKRRIKMRGFG